MATESIATETLSRSETMGVNFSSMEYFLKEARLAYYTFDQKRLQGCVHLLKLMLDELVDARGSVKSSIVHPAGTSEIQAEAVRADRAENRDSSSA
jgi:hypothetical protein